MLQSTQHSFQSIKGPLRNDPSLKRPYSQRLFSKELTSTQEVRERLHLKQVALIMVVPISISTLKWQSEANF